jgi:hypothetical protein
MLFGDDFSGFCSPINLIHLYNFSVCRNLPCLVRSHDPGSQSQSEHDKSKQKVSYCIQCGPFHLGHGLIFYTSLADDELLDHTSRLSRWTAGISYQSQFFCICHFWGRTRLPPYFADGWVICKLGFIVIVWLTPLAYKPLLWRYSI